MDLSGHLLYIDITQVCGIGCAFCMYAEKHKAGRNMELSPLALKNLASLINSPDVKRISISGEGEPLNNVKVFHQILELSRGGRTFEFVTSGFLPHDKLLTFYERTNAMVTERGDTCNIRLSSDSHHIEKIKHRAHGFSIRYLRNRRPEGLTFSFRSIDTDRAFTRGYLIAELSRWGLDGRIETRSTLEDALIVDGQTFGVDYKNLVHPSPGTPSGYLDMNGYISAIEEKTQKPFTLGSLNKPPLANGIDLTVKPDGDVFFYGIENERVGNIHIDRISWQGLSQHVAETPLIRALYTRPFIDLVSRLQEDQLTQSILTTVNNPYWVVKALARHGGLLERMIAS
ncbi:radical SAM protein [Burkholderia gladioli]|uniref:radical SAM protein n=1 Tax=Burkholderia gladioli TaxID=28095 RepID=UPI0034DB0DDB